MKNVDSFSAIDLPDYPKYNRLNINFKSGHSIPFDSCKKSKTEKKLEAEMSNFLKNKKFCNLIDEQSIEL